jgi:hypothetical protein
VHAETGGLLAKEALERSRRNGWACTRKREPSDERLEPEPVGDAVSRLLSSQQYRGAPKQLHVCRHPQRTARNTNSFKRLITLEANPQRRPAK